MESDDNEADDIGGDDARRLDELAAAIAAAADRVEIGDPDAMFVTVQSTAARHRRLRAVSIGLAAAGVLVVSGVVIASFAAGSETDQIANAPRTEPPPTDRSTSDPPTTESAEVVPAVSDPLSTDVLTVPAEAVPVDVVPSEASVVTDPELSAASQDGQLELFPWQDGFLSVRTSIEPQPLPTKLPDEVVDAFPPEVVELFPDGLPATIREATQRLQDAGLLDVVTEIMADNPDVADAIYSQPSAAPTRIARFSSDGIEWQDIETSFPDVDDLWDGATSTGERFVFATIADAPTGPSDETVADTTPPTPETIEIHSSTDLIDWSVQTIPFPERPDDVDPALPYSAYIQGLAATDDGYVLSVDATVDFDVISLLDPELQERINTGGGMSMTQGDAGVTIGLYAPDDDPSGLGEPTETLTFTWEELGIDDPLPLEPMNTLRRYAGSWDGGPTESTDSSVAWSTVTAVGDRFVEFGGSASQSADGIEWTPIDLTSDGVVDALVETADGAVVRTTDGRGAPLFHVGDLAADEWTPMSVPDLPAGVQNEAAAPGAFLLADYGNEGFEDENIDSIGTRESAEIDGYRYEFESTRSGDDITVTYRLIDIATDNVVVTETVDGGLPGEPFEFLEYQSDFGDGFRILDSESGEPIVSIPYDAVTRQLILADGSSTDVPDVETLDPGADSMPPRYWLLAFVGDGWILQQVSDGSEIDAYASSVAVADGVALVAMSNGTVVRVAAS